MGLLKLFLVGVVALVALGLVLWIVGIVFGIATFLLFKVLPLLVIGYLVVHFIGARKDKNLASSADRKWLES